MIALSSIEVTFNPNTPIENKVLNDLNLEIKQGEFITLIGGNGSGKSTLMNVLSGEVIPNKGKIIFDNQDVTKLITSKRAAYISRIFQDPRLGSCPELSIEENLALADTRGKSRGFSLATSKAHRTEYQKRLAELGIGLEERLNTPMGLLSGGQRQAVALVMATLQPSKILLLDEHTAALDPKMAQTVLMLTNKLIQKYHLTAIMITHHMSHALEYGNRTLLIEQGKIAQDFSKEDRKNLKPQDLLALFEI